MSVKSTAERYAELLTQRSLTINLIANAKRWRDEMASLSPTEAEYWQQRAADLEQQLREENAHIRVLLSQEDKDRFADERDAYRREDDDFCGAQNATDWESA